MGTGIAGLYAGALASLVVATILMRHTSPFSRCGASTFEWRARWRLVGKVLFAIGMVCLLVAVISQVWNMEADRG